MPNVTRSKLVLELTDKLISLTGYRNKLAKLGQRNTPDDLAADHEVQECAAKISKINDGGTINFPTKDQIDALEIAVGQLDDAVANSNNLVALANLSKDVINKVPAASI